MEDPVTSSALHSKQPSYRPIISDISTLEFFPIAPIPRDFFFVSPEKVVQYSVQHRNNGGKTNPVVQKLHVMLI